MAVEKADKKTIGITPANEKTLTALAGAGKFVTDIDAAKFAMALAVSKDIGSGATEGAGTKWNIGSFDNDGTLKSTIEALYPEEGAPYRLIEHLINEGLHLMSTSDGLLPDVAGAILTAADQAK